MTIRVVIADDNPVVRMGLASLLEIDDIEVCAQASSGPEALALAREHRPDVVLLDVRMPGGSGLEVLGELREVTRVLMLTYTDEPAVVSEALRNGATGYLVHGAFDSNELARAVRDTAAGASRLSPQAVSVLMQGAIGGDQEARPPSGLDTDAVRRHALSPREIEIAEELVLGSTNKQIAATLFIEEKTVKNHLNRMFAKLSAENRSAAISTLLGLRSPHAETTRR